MEKLDSSLNKFLSDDDKDNLNLIYDAILNKQSNILVTCNDENTLKIIHKHLSSDVKRNKERNIAIYDSKKLENFVADTLLGSYDNALSKLNQTKEKKLEEKYYRRVLFVENGHLLDKNEINVLIESNKSDSYGFGVIVIFFNTKKNNNDLLEKINLFGENVFKWEPDKFNNQISVKKDYSNHIKDDENNVAHKDENNKENFKKSKKNYNFFSRLISLFLALLTILLLFALLAFLGGFDFKKHYTEFLLKKEIYFKKLQEIPEAFFKKDLISEYPSIEKKFHINSLYDFEKNSNFFLQHFSSNNKKLASIWLLENSNKIKNCKIIKLKSAKEGDYYFAIISGPYKSIDEASEYKKNNLIAEKSWIRPARRLIEQVIF